MDTTSTSQLRDDVDLLRKERRVLLSHILATSMASSSELRPAVVLPSGATGLWDVDLDVVSTVYVMECVSSGKRRGPFGRPWCLRTSG